MNSFSQKRFLGINKNDFNEQPLSEARESLNEGSHLLPLEL